MRPPLPDTRSRRHDPEQLGKVTKLKRLKNGFRDDHVTTRSQAKKRVSKSKKSLAKNLKYNNKLSPRKRTSGNTSSSSISSNRSSTSNNSSSNNNNNKDSDITGSKSSRLNGIICNGTRSPSGSSSSSFTSRLKKIHKDRRLKARKSVSEELAEAGSIANSNGNSNRGRNVHINWNLKVNGNGLHHSRLSSIGDKTSNKSHLLFTHHRYQFQNNQFEGKGSERERVAFQRAVAAEKRADRAKKRRSALWVLNCEAESFLFGETAADKHEVELPPLSPPPKKRRQIRTNELGTLLKESSIIGSKLRSPIPQQSSSKAHHLLQQHHGFSNKVSPVVPDCLSSSNSIASSNMCRKSPIKNSNSNSRKLTLDFPGKDLSVGLSVQVKDSFTDEILPELSVKKDYDELMSLASPLSSSMGSPNSHSNYSNSECSNSQSVRIQNILNSMELKFSFEELPTDEVWYSTFKRQENPIPSSSLSPAERQQRYNYFSSLTRPPVLLPYETKLIQQPQPRSLTKRNRLSRLPRKSPRCHASTLAILSSLKRGRNRNSTLLQQSPALLSPTNSTGVLSPQASPGSPITAAAVTEPAANSSSLHHHTSSNLLSITTATTNNNNKFTLPTITVTSPPNVITDIDDVCVNQIQLPSPKPISKYKAKRFQRFQTSSKGGDSSNLLSPSASSSFTAANSSTLSQHQHRSHHNTISNRNQLTVNSWRTYSLTKNKALPPVSPPMLSSTRLLSPRPSSPNRTRDISATQYLWDSIQLLSDPYVIQVLAGEMPSSSPNNNKNGTKTPCYPLPSNTIKNSLKDKYRESCVNKTANVSNNKLTTNNTKTTTMMMRDSSPKSPVINSSNKIPTPKNSPNSKASHVSNVSSNNKNNNHINGVKLNNFSCSQPRTCKYKEKQQLGNNNKVSTPKGSPNNYDLKYNNISGNNSNCKANDKYNSCDKNKSNNPEQIKNNKLHPPTKNVNNNNNIATHTNGIRSHYSHRRNSPRKSPVVLLEILKLPKSNGSANNCKKETAKPSSAKKHHKVGSLSTPSVQPSNCINSNANSQEQILFLMDSLPALPPWPV